MRKLVVTEYVTLDGVNEDIQLRHRSSLLPTSRQRRIKLMIKQPQDDRILLVTRLVALAVIPFLVMAFIILFIFPQLSGERFAWQIKPNLMAVYMGAGYLGGAYVFLQTLIGRRWHRVAGGYLAVTSFTIMMLLATILHWSRFDLHNLAFQIWLVLYVVTPFLVPWLWWHNKPVDSGAPEEQDAVVPAGFRFVFRIFGFGMIFVALAGLVYPTILIRVWPWTLTPLTARVLAGWGSLIAIGNLVISNDRRWSSWRVGAVSIGLWHLLFLVGSVIHWQDFNGGQWLNWFTITIMGVLIFVSGLYIRMESVRSRMKNATSTSQTAQNDQLRLLHENRSQ